MCVTVIEGDINSKKGVVEYQECGVECEEIKRESVKDGVAPS